METKENSVNSFNELQLSEMDQSKLASIVESTLSSLSFQDIDEIVETIQHKLEFYVLEGSSIGVRDIKQFRQLFRIYGIYKDILYPGLLESEHDKNKL